MNPDVNVDVEADIKYKVSNDGTYAFALECLNRKMATTATIASTYNGVPVIMIGHGIFANCSSLSSISIPDSVTMIGDSAFANCTSLTSITIPSSVTSVDCDAFNGCTSLTSVTIPDSVASIGDGAFAGCSSLSSISIPSTVASIGERAFNCPNLEKVIITLNDKTEINDDHDNRVWTRQHLKKFSLKEFIDRWF